MSHTLYLIYDEIGKITDYVVDNVDTTKNFISYVHGPESFVNSVANNLKAFLSAHGNVQVDSDYIIAGRHGSFDTAYGKIEDENSSASSSSATPVSSTSASSTPNTSSSSSSQSSTPNKNTIPSSSSTTQPVSNSSNSQTQPAPNNSTTSNNSISTASKSSNGK